MVRRSWNMVFSSVIALVTVAALTATGTSIRTLFNNIATNLSA